MNANKLRKSVTATMSAAPRNGQTSPILIVLLSGILATLLILVVVLISRGGSVAEYVATETPQPPPPSNRIRETARAGKTYHSVLKAGFDARVEDEDWGIRKVVNVLFSSEFVVDRTIESNDGKRIIELRHFVTARCAKVLCDAEEVSFNLGIAGDLALQGLNGLNPGSGRSLVLAKPIAEAILGKLAEGSMQDAVTKATAQIGSIQGKKVRITFVAGEGVTALEPIDCVLTAAEKGFLQGTATLSDYYLMPDLNIPVGQTWSVSGSEFAGFFDSSWNGIPIGTITVVREPNGNHDGKELANLRVQSGVLELNASNQKSRKIGSFTPQGRIQFAVADGYVQKADLHGNLRIDEVSKDHLLFKASFRTQPKLRVLYSCEMH